MRARTEGVHSVSDLRFLFFADTQLGCYATFTGMTAEEAAGYARRDMKVPPMPRVEGFEWDARRYQLAITAANELKPDFVVVGGDMIDDLSDADQIDEFFRITGRLNDQIPIRWVPGNHDVAFDAAVPTAESIARYRSLFGDDFYRFEHGPALFVVINSVVATHPERVPDEWEAQLAFLRSSLAEAADGGRRVILLGHHPLFVQAADEADSYWNVPHEQRSAILALLHEHDVRIGFAGHRHRNGLAWDGDFQMVTSGPVGFPLGDDPSGFRVVEVSEHGVTHRYVPLDE